MPASSPRQNARRPVARPAPGVRPLAKLEPNSLAPQRSLTFATIRTKRIFEEICEQVRRELASGALRPGDKLPAERHLAVQFGVSRPALREALRGLEAAGVVSLHKGLKGGAYVLKGDPEIVTRSVQDLFHLGGLSLANLTEARTVMMQSVVVLAAQRIDDTILAALERNIAALAAMPPTVGAAERSSSSAEFYALIARATGNAALQAMVGALTVVVLEQVGRVRPRALPDLVAHRKRLVKHLGARDGDAATLEITRHLKRLHEHLARERALPAML